MDKSRSVVNIVTAMGNAADSILDVMPLGVLVDPKGNE